MFAIHYRKTLPIVIKMSKLRLLAHVGHLRSHPSNGTACDKAERKTDSDVVGQRAFVGVTLKL